MKLHNDFQTSTLIDIAGQIAYHEKQINEIASQNGCTEIEQIDVDNIALYMSNYWLNNDEEQNKDGSPLQNRRDYFENNYGQVIEQYCKDPNGLEPIEYIKFSPSQNDNPPNINKQRNFMTVADIRYGNYDNDLPIIMSSERGCYLMPQTENLKRYIREEDKENVGDIMPMETKDDEYTVEAIVF